MASLRRLPRSPNFIACFTGADGRRYQRSTGIRADGRVDSRRKAQRIADEYEDVSRKRRTAEQVHRVFRELFADAQGEDLPNATFTLYFARWISSKKVEVSPATYSSYRNKVGAFGTFLGDKADRPMAVISKNDVRDWRDQEAKRVGNATVNVSLKMLRVFFSSAKREGLIAENPAEGVPSLKRGVSGRRRPFTVAEIEALLKAADLEWRSMILFGLYTGQRLGDVARLTWDQVDREAGEIRLAAGKTGRFQKIPIAPPLARHIGSLPEGEQPRSPLHPRAHRICEVQGRSGSLSIQFSKIMLEAGLVKKTAHRKSRDRAGDGAHRASSELSFHSLRHTTTSMLKNAGVSSAIAEEFVGHDSAEMNRVYTHLGADAMRKAAATLPDVV